LKILSDSNFISEKTTTKKEEMIQTAKNSSVREIELVCLKNRYGDLFFDCEYKYYPKYDYFEEVEVRKV
jgi:hypothetical protein